MRKFILLYFVFLTALTIHFFMPIHTEKMDKVTLYFADRQMMRLVPTDFYIAHSDVEKEANMIVHELLKGRDTNCKIRRMLPSSSDAIKVRVKDNVAYICINKKYMSEYEQGRAQEELTVYQLVNSVCSADGISRVKFLFDGKSEKEFLGELDMREAFIPDYSI